MYGNIKWKTTCLGGGERRAVARRLHVPVERKKAPEIFPRKIKPAIEGSFRDLISWERTAKEDNIHRINITAERLPCAKTRMVRDDTCFEPR